MSNALAVNERETTEAVVDRDENTTEQEKKGATMDEFVNVFLEYVKRG